MCSKFDDSVKRSHTCKSRNFNSTAVIYSQFWKCIIFFHYYSLVVRFLRMVWYRIDCRIYLYLFINVHLFKFPHSFTLICPIMNNTTVWLLFRICLFLELSASHTQTLSAFCFETPLFFDSFYWYPTKITAYVCDTSIYTTMNDGFFFVVNIGKYTLSEGYYSIASNMTNPNR